MTGSVDPLSPFAAAADIARAVAAGVVSAAEATEARLARIAAVDPAITAFTDVVAERARRTAAALDAARALGRPLGPLAGVPFAAKNLFDIAGLPTRAGAKINRTRPPAAADAALVRRLEAAGAVLTGALNMGEFAYDFTGENAHDGACRNPHDLGRMSGGSSSGAGAATAAGLAPISLGSDTNGSMRVPASLCGVFSLKPTYGRLPRSGAFPFVDSLDHVGPFARTAQDLAIAYDALQGWDEGDHACVRARPAPTAPSCGDGVADLRIGVAGGWFVDNAGPEALAATRRIVGALTGAAALEMVTIDGVEAGRAAAYLITNAESSAFHLDRLRRQASDFDPDTRDRFLAGALLPAAWLTQAQRVRRWQLERMLAAFRGVDVLIAPATPCSAPPIGAKMLELGGRSVLLRPNLGALAQPFSCVGLPVATVPAFEAGAAPIGVQLVAPPWREDLCLRVARFLESTGASIAHPPTL